jgi:hypothetical protein
MNIQAKIAAVCTVLLAWCSPAASQNWQGIGNFDGSVSILYSDTIDNILYSIGGFDSVDGKDVNRIARWNNNTWDSLRSGNTSGNNIYAIERYNNDIYVGGGFNQMGNIPCTQIARWNGNAWDTLQVQPFNNIPFGSASIYSLMTYNNELYVGGAFTEVAGIPVNSLAKWNGSTWSNVYSCPNFGNPNYIFSMSVFNGELYIGGNFQGSNGMQDIARWDGMQWRDVGGGLKGGFADVRKMVVYNGSLYVGGSILMSDGNAGNSIMKWDGSNWSDVGGGIGGLSFSWVDDMVVFNNYLYVTGVFSDAGGVYADRIARWDGTNWCSLGASFNQNILTITVHNDTLLIGGAFSSISSTATSHIGQWVGGNYVDNCGNTTTVNEKTNSDSKVKLYPNPFTSSTTFEITDHNILPYALSLYDNLGREVRKISQITTPQYRLNREDLSPGMYFYRVQSHNAVLSGKLVIE